MTNLNTIERELNPFPFYRKMRQDNPVYFNTRNQNWHVFRYDEVQNVLSDWNTFSSHFQGENAQSADMPFSASMISSDPPRHRKLRTLVTQAFTPKAVDSLAPRITEIVQEHLDRVMSAGQMDVIKDLGIPLPVIVIAELLGVPAADREKFKRWSDIIVGFGDFGEGEMDPEEFSNPAILEMSAYFFNMIEQRRQEPRDDLISGLLAANIDGEHLNPIELLGFCALLLVAGNETTTNLIGNAMHTFAEQSEIWARLRSTPELLPGAIEEVLRYRSPVQSMFRVTKTGVSLNGQDIPSGSPMVAWIGSANHDDSQFPDPECFDIERKPNRHLAFGQGIHYCLGAPLARLEAEIALSAMLERFKSFQLAPGATLERQPSMIVYGVRKLPIAFTKA